MKIFDISVPVHNAMAVWPGDPAVNNFLVNSIKNGDEANVTSVQMSAHTGTHIDAPCHFIDGGRTIDQLDLSLLVGDVEVIEIDKENNIISEDTLSGLGIKQWPQRVIFKTNNSYRELMKNNEFYKDFVALSVDGSKYLIKQGVQLIGIDYLSIAPFENGDETHIELLKHEVVVIEGLNLVNIKPGSYQLIALPINLKGADGAPARVLLIEE